MVFQSETDTEVIPHLLAAELKQLQAAGEAQAVGCCWRPCRGCCPSCRAYATAVIWDQAPGALVVARKAAPLLIGGEGEFFCASDTPALAGFTRLILPMEDGELTPCSHLWGWSSMTPQGAVSNACPPSSAAWITWRTSEFRHFMLKEIHEQPETAELWVTRHLPQDFRRNSRWLPMDDAFYAGIEQIQILACGTSRHAAMVGAYLLEQFAGIPTSVHYASEFRYAPRRWLLTPSPLA